jgi:hypothetical protein
MVCTIAGELRLGSRKWELYRGVDGAEKEESRRGEGGGGGVEKGDWNKVRRWRVRIDKVKGDKEQRMVLIKRS